MTLLMHFWTTLMNVGKVGHLVILILCNCRCLVAISIHVLEFLATIDFLFSRNFLWMLLTLPLVFRVLIRTRGYPGF